MDLVLWRHADAESGIPDAERRLTPEGRRQAEHIAGWLRPRLRQDCIDGEQWIASGRPFDTEMKLRYRRNVALAVRLVTQAVDSLHEMAGANGIYDTYPLQRMFRDTHAGAAHINFSVDVQYPGWGLVALGGEFKSPTL